MTTEVIHHTCDRCLEPDYRCGCLSWDLDERNRPEVAWLASRPLKPGSKVTKEKKHRYEKACKEVNNPIPEGRGLDLYSPANWLSDP